MDESRSLSAGAGARAARSIARATAALGLAAGLALAAPVQAVVVFTADSTVLTPPPNGGTQHHDINFNGDSLIDFAIEYFASEGQFDGPVCSPTGTGAFCFYNAFFQIDFDKNSQTGDSLNAVLGGADDAAALSAGALISDAGITADVPEGAVNYADHRDLGAYGYGPFVSPPTFTETVMHEFPGAGTSYIGVRFQDGAGDLHFGWICIDIDGLGPYPAGDESFDATMCGYAYETEVGVSILAGSLESIGVPEPTTLGLLAGVALPLIGGLRRRRPTARG